MNKTGFFLSKKNGPSLGADTTFGKPSSVLLHQSVSKNQMEITNLNIQMFLFLRNPIKKEVKHKLVINIQFLVSD